MAGGDDGGGGIGGGTARRYPIETRSIPESGALSNRAIRTSTARRDILVRTTTIETSSAGIRVRSRHDNTTWCSSEVAPLMPHLPRAQAGRLDPPGSSAAARAMD